MESTHIATLQIPGIIYLAKYIHTLTKMQTAPLISLGVLCDDGFTITLYKQKVEEIIKGARNKKTGMWEVPLGPQQLENLVNNILAKTSKPEIAQYLHAALFSPKTESLLNAIKQGFLKIWPGLTEKLIKKQRKK